MSEKRIATVISLSIALSLLLGGSFVYAGVSQAWGDGEVVPSVSYIDVLGDNEKFAEDHWIKKGVTGGVSDFNLIKEYRNGDSIALEGRAIAGNNDYLFD